MKCILCGRELDGHKTEVHHISYPVKGYPEITVEVHKKCHDVIHYTDHYIGLKPREGHSPIYYNKENNNVKEYDKKSKELEKINLCSVNIDSIRYGKRIMRIIDDFRDEHLDGVPTEAILREAKDGDASEADIKQGLDTLRQYGVIFKPREGKYALLDKLGRNNNG